MKTKNKTTLQENVKMFLFARWISTQYADDHLDDKMRYCDNKNYDDSTAISILNKENGLWYKTQLEYFNKTVYPNYIKNGSADSAFEFLKDVL